MVGLTNIRLLTPISCLFQRDALFVQLEWNDYLLQQLPASIVSIMYNCTLYGADYIQRHLSSTGSNGLYSEDSEDVD